MARRFLRLLGSARFAQTVMTVLLGLIVAWVLPLQFLGISAEWVKHVVYGTFPFLAAYAALVVALLACTLRRFGPLSRRLSRHPRTNVGGRPVLLELPFDETRARRALGRLGFRRIVIGSEQVWALRNPIGPAGSIMLHLGIVAVIAGGALSTLPSSTFVGRARITQGETFNGGGSAFFEEAHGSDRPGGVERLAFRVERIDAAGLRGLPPDRLDVAVSRDGGRPIGFSPGIPLLYAADTLVAAEDYSYTPRLSLIPSGAVLPAARVAPRLANGRSGTPETVETTVDGTPYRLALAVGRRGRELSVSVARLDPEGGWRLESRAATLALGESRKLGSMTIRLDDVRPNVTVRVTTMPYGPVVGLGVLLVTLGALLRLLFPRTEVSLRAEGEGTAATVSIDVYRDGSSMLRRLVREWERGKAA